MTAVFLVLIVSTVELFASSQSEESSTVPSVIPMRYAVPGGPPKDVKTAMNAVNEALKKDEINIEVETMYIPWDAWNQKTNIMLSSGEPFELIHVMENVLPSQTYAARGALAPLDDLLERYGQDLLKRIRQVEWDAVKMNGEIFAVPARWAEFAGKGASGEISVRKDLLDKYGLQIPETPAQALDVAEAMQEAVEEELGETWYCWHHTLDMAELWFFRALDSYPFYVDYSEEIIYLKDGKAQAFYETEEFRLEAEYNKEMYKRGLRHPDVLSVPFDVKNKTVREGRMLIGFGQTAYPSLPTTKQTFPDAEYITFYFNPEKPYYEALPVWNSNSVPATTDYPEAGVQFLN